MQQVSIRAAGHTILEDIDFHIEAGSHVAIIGPSGAGKSTLVGILLGWHRPATGNVLVDGSPLRSQALDRLRHETAWVDPGLQLWNRSLFDNLGYGNSVDLSSGLTHIIAQADLIETIQKLPDGLQTALGEGGGLVSGGEGQQVRLGRAMLQSEARLVILDEPFRGLDRRRRHELLARARNLWQQSTLLCITHDVSETRAFERVLILEHGRIVEDGSPARLMRQQGSRYRATLNAERTVLERIWSNGWRRLKLENGKLMELSRNDKLNT